MWRAGVKCDRRAAGNTLRGAGRSNVPGGRDGSVDRWTASHKDERQKGKRTNSLGNKKNKNPAHRHRYSHKTQTEAIRQSDQWSTTGPLQGPSPTQQDLQRATAQSAMSVSLHPNDDATNMAAASIHRGQTLVYLQHWSEALTRPGQTQCSVFSSAPY